MIFVGSLQALYGSFPQMLHICLSSGLVLRNTPSMSHLMLDTIKSSQIKDEYFHHNLLVSNYSFLAEKRELT